MEIYSVNLKRLCDIPRIKETQAASTAPTNPQLKKLQKGIRQLFGAREIVAGGEILWKPVNKPAAMLLAKSPDINKPIMQQEPTTKKTIQQQESAIVCAVSSKLIKESEQTKKNVVKFSDEVVQARRYLDEATDQFRGEMIRFIEECPKNVEKIRQWRMAMEREKEMSLKALQDLRKFFLDSDHDKEMTRLIDFVRVCERLAALAKDGTLDKVADVMLKLATP